MGKVKLVTFATTVTDAGFQDLELYQLRLHQSATKVGIGQIESWTRTRLKGTDFYKQNEGILQAKKGAGFCAWKPYIILEALKNADLGDFVIYADCTTVFKSGPETLLKLCESNGGFFLITQDSFGQNAKYIKRDCFILMECDTSFYHRAPMTEAFFQIYQKNTQTVRFVDEYAKYCLHKDVVTDYPNTLGQPNLPQFITHKYDMSVLSLLRLKYSIAGFRNPSQWGNHQKLEEYKVAGEFLHAAYREPMQNSPYGSILGWRENREGLHRPLRHYFDPVKVYHKLKRLFKE